MYLFSYSSAYHALKNCHLTSVPVDDAGDDFDVDWELRE